MAEASISQAVEKRCCTCDQMKPVDDFYHQQYTTNSGKRKTRLKSECKVCGLSRGKETRKRLGREYLNKSLRRWRANNRDHSTAYHREYRKNNPAKAKLYGAAGYAKRRAAGFVTTSEARAAIAQVLELYRVGDLYLDVYSGELIKNAAVDHIVPLSRGGGPELENLCVTSKHNNSSKSDNSLLIWMIKRANQFHAT